MNHIIFGGAFDPIHNGHLKMADIASKRLNADVFFVVPRISVWKEESAPIMDKINMLEIAIKPYNNFKIDLFEANSKKDVNYTIDTIKHFIETYPDDKFYLLIGSEHAEVFDKWRAADEIASLVQIVCFPRKDHNQISENIKRFNIQMLDGEVMPISSSEVRNLSCLDIPFEVAKYIEEHELYYIKKIKSYLKPSRYAHTISVAHLAYNFALSNKFNNPMKAYVAGLLHDIGKYVTLSDEEMKIAMEGNEDITNPKLAHQFIGAKMARDIFYINDEEIISAIKYHTTGHGNMTELEKIIYAADKLDPLRGYDSAKMIEQSTKNIDEGFLEILKEDKRYLLKHGIEINDRLSKECLEYYKI